MSRFRRSLTVMSFENATMFYYALTFRTFQGATMFYYALTFQTCQGAIKNINHSISYISFRFHRDKGHCVQSFFL
jgi:hypothetical protein